MKYLNFIPSLFTLPSNEPGTIREFRMSSLFECVRQSRQLNMLFF